MIETITIAMTGTEIAIDATAALTVTETEGVMIAEVGAVALVFM